MIAVTEPRDASVLIPEHAKMSKTPPLRYLNFSKTNFAGPAWLETTLDL